MSALFQRIAEPVLKAVSSRLLPLLDVTTGDWYGGVSTTCADPPNGIFRVERVTPHVGDDTRQPGWTLKLPFGNAEVGLAATPPEHVCAVVLVWDEVSLSNAVGRAVTGYVYGYARFLTPAETVEWLVEEETP